MPHLGFDLDPSAEAHGFQSQLPLTLQRNSTLLGGVDAEDTHFSSAVFFPLQQLLATIFVCIEQKKKEHLAHHLAFLIFEME